MTTKNDGGPAFPNEGGVKFALGNDLRKTLPSTGMTLRDYFAAKALSLTASCFTQEDLATWDYKHFAEHAYGVADAMLLERAK